MTAPTYQGQDLPLPIQRAIARLMDPEFPVALSASERMALAALLRRVEARDGASAFWVRRCNLAEMFDCVERTITNWLAALEDKGLIAKEQGRTRWGNFKSLTLHLSGAAIELLGLSAVSRPRLSTAEGNFSSYGHKEEVYQEHSLSERHSAALDCLTTTAAPRGQIPDDCAPLLSMGLTAPAIFKLMGIAARHGKRLGDIVQARAKPIAAARKPFALLCTLASDGVDYAAVGRSEQERLSMEAARIEQQKAVEDAQTRFVGAEFNLGQDRKARVQSGYVEVMTWAAGAWNYAGAMAGQGLLRFWGRVASGQLLPAHPLRDDTQPFEHELAIADGRFE